MSKPLNPKATRRGAIQKRPTRSRKAPLRIATSLNRPPDDQPTVLIEKTYLNAEELAHFRQLLINKLKQLTGDIENLDSQSIRSLRQDSAGDLSRMPIHMADVGSDAFHQELSAGLIDSNHKIVQEILAALDRIDRGVYGMCEGTGKPIPKQRLEAFPWARYCVEYAQKLEKK